MYIVYDISPDLLIVLSSVTLVLTATSLFNIGKSRSKVNIKNYFPV